MSAIVSVQKLNPKRDFLVIKADEVEQRTTTESGIHLPDEAQRIEIKRTGVVVEIGPEVKNTVVGEKVLFGAYAGTTVEIGGVEFEFMQDKHVYAGIE